MHRDVAMAETVDACCRLQSDLASATRHGINIDLGQLFWRLKATSEDGVYC